MASPTRFKEELKREFYIEILKVERWSVRTLRERINSLFFERTAVAKQPEQIIANEIKELREKGIISQNLAFRDPYLLEFAGLRGDFSENDLENAILNELSTFFLELGNDFCFVARQKKMSTAQTDRYLDLLFYHRRMKRLIAIELKRGKFCPRDKGQMEWYLKWLDKHEKREGELAPLGIILCADKEDEDVELLELGQNGIHVAQYLTENIDKSFLERRLHETVVKARMLVEDSNLKLE